MIRYGDGIYKILKKRNYWYVGRLLTADSDGTPVYQCVSNLYRFRGWADAFCRRMKIKVYD